jgi:hypothetical protein
MGEIGHSKLADSHIETISLPGGLTADQVSIPVDCAGKRITFMGCICLDGQLMKPIVAIPQHTIDNDLPFLGVRFQLSPLPSTQCFY